MKSQIQILTTSSSNSRPCLLLTYDSRKYLFNCPQETQRFCLSNNVKINKLESILFTRDSWDYAGGIIGMSHQIKNVNDLNHVSCHGSTRIEEIIKVASSYTRFLLLILVQISVFLLFQTMATSRMKT